MSDPSLRRFCNVPGCSCAVQNPHDRLIAVEQELLSALARIRDMEKALRIAHDQVKILGGDPQFALDALCL